MTDSVSEALGELLEAAKGVLTGGHAGHREKVRARLRAAINQAEAAALDKARAALHSSHAAREDDYYDG